MAGSRAVSEALAIMLLLVLQHPHVHARLAAELDHAEASGILDGDDRDGAVPALGVATDKLLLPYANACIAEGVHMGSPPALVPRYPPPEGLFPTPILATTRSSLQKFVCSFVCN